MFANFNTRAPEVEDAHIDILIATQAGVITTDEKKLKQLQTNSIELQNKITKLQEDMSANSKAQETQLAEIANQRKIREGIKSRKKI